MRIEKHRGGGRETNAWGWTFPVVRKDVEPVLIPRRGGVPKTKPYTQINGYRNSRLNKVGLLSRIYLAVLPHSFWWGRTMLY